MFANEYLPTPDEPWGRFQLAGYRSDSTLDGKDGLSVNLTVDGEPSVLSAGGDASAAAYVECAVDGRVLWGVGVDANIVTASLKAVVSAVNRAVRG